MKNGIRPKANGSADLLRFSTINFGPVCPLLREHYARLIIGCKCTTISNGKWNDESESVVV